MLTKEVQQELNAIFAADSVSLTKASGKQHLMSTTVYSQLLNWLFQVTDSSKACQVQPALSLRARLQLANSRSALKNRQFAKQQKGRLRLTKYLDNRIKRIANPTKGNIQKAN